MTENNWTNLNPQDMQWCADTAPVQHLPDDTQKSASVHGTFSFPTFDIDSRACFLTQSLDQGLGTGYTHGTPLGCGHAVPYNWIQYPSTRQFNREDTTHASIHTPVNPQYLFQGEGSRMFQTITSQTAEHNVMEPIMARRQSSYTYRAMDPATPSALYGSDQLTACNLSPSQSSSGVSSGPYSPGSDDAGSSEAGSAQIYECSVQDCTSKKRNFARKADLQRHMTCVHDKENSKVYDCPWPKCARRGSRSFNRKDHLKEHRRSYHHEDLPKGRGGG